MGLFTSDYEEEAPRYTRENLGRVDSLKSAFTDVRGLSDLATKYGLTPFDLKGYESGVKNLFGTQKRALGSSLGRRRQALANRMGGQSANPEFAFSGLEGAFADAYGGLQGNEASALLEGQDKQRSADQFGAGFLANIFGQKDRFKLGKQGLRNEAVQRYLATLDQTSGFDDLLSLGGAAAQIATPFYRY